MNEIELKEELQRLSRELEQIREETVDNGKSRKKDAWDKLSAVSPFLSGVLIAIIGLYFTYTYNERQSQRDAALKEQQIQVSQVQTLEKFMPYLLASENEKKIALLAIYALGNSQLASNLAILVKGQGALDALTSLAITSSNDETKAIAKQALRSTLQLDRDITIYDVFRIGKNVWFTTNSGTYLLKGNIATKFSGVFGYFILPQPLSDKNRERYRASAEAFLNNFRHVYEIVLESEGLKLVVMYWPLKSGYDDLFFESESNEDVITYMLGEYDYAKAREIAKTMGVEEKNGPILVLSQQCFEAELGDSPYLIQDLSFVPKDIVPIFVREFKSQLNQAQVTYGTDPIRKLEILLDLTRRILSGSHQFQEKVVK